MTGLLDVIQERLQEEGKALKSDLGTLGNYSRSRVEFPKAVEEFLYEKESKSSFSEEKALLIQKVDKLCEFFVLNPLLNLRNFPRAKALILDLFGSENTFKEAFVHFAEALDKRTDKKQKHGKAYLSCSKSGSLCLERSSYELGYVKQYLKVDFEKQDLLAYTVWVDKAKGVEIIRSSKGVRKPASEESLNFDVNVWKSFNKVGVLKDNYLKTLDCLERNHLNLEAFISQVNEKNIFNLLQPRMIENASILTNGRDTTYLDFDAGDEHRLSVKIAKGASSILISRITKQGNKV